MGKPLPHQAILDSLARLRAGWPSRGWSYDNRFDCVASSFATEFVDTTRRLITASYPLSFDHRTLATASPAIKAAAERTGGVRAGQLIYGGPTVGRITPYALWWPWEEAQTISLRIGLEGAGFSELDDLRRTFGVEL